MTTDRPSIIRLREPGSPPLPEGTRAELHPLTDDDRATIAAATYTRAELDAIEADAALAEAFDALDTIRSSGAVNMFGAAPILADTLGLDRDAARAAVVAWMTTYRDDATAAERVAELRAADG